jgi:hypothetical protein
MLPALAQPLVDRKPLLRARKTERRLWVASDRADEGDMLTFRSCDRWMNDPSIWEDMEEERLGLA